MTSEERSAWIMALVAAAGYGTYLAFVLPQAGARELASTDYVAPLLWTVGGGILANIVLRVVGTVFARKGDEKRDDRDRQIYQFGQSIGNAFVVAAALAALLMALLAWQGFWIANVIYLGFVLSAIVSSVARIASYRGEFRGW